MNLDELTDAMTATASGDYKTSVRLMVKCLRVIPFPVPDVVITGIELARRYWKHGSASETDLERARVACWNYLDHVASSTNTIEPEFCAIRAVICVLYPNAPSDDIGELIDFFNQMLRGTLAKDDEDSFSEKVMAVVEEFTKKQ